MSKCRRIATASFAEAPTGLLRSLSSARPSTYPCARCPRFCLSLRLYAHPSGGPAEDGESYPPSSREQQQRPQYREEVWQRRGEQRRVDRQEHPRPPGQRPRPPHREAKEDEARRVKQESRVEDTPVGVPEDDVGHLHSAVFAAQVRPTQSRDSVGAQAIVREQQTQTQDA